MTKERKYTLDQMLGPRPAAWKVVMATVGLLAVAVATLMPILNVLITYGAAGTWWKYLFAAGALLFLAGKLLSPYRGEHPRIRRLYRIESWSAIFFCVAAFFPVLQRLGEPRQLGLHPCRGCAAGVHYDCYSAHRAPRTPSRCGRD